MTSAILMLLLITGCSSVNRMPGLAMETSEFLFALGETSSEHHDRSIPLPVIRSKADGQLVMEIGKNRAGFEWVRVQESPAGIVAAMDYSIEGRVQEIPVIYRRSTEALWREISFIKPHFSAEVEELEIHPGGIRLRLNLDPELAPSGSLTGRTKDEDGSPLGFSDWLYPFTSRAWRFLPGIAKP